MSTSSVEEYVQSLRARDWVKMAGTLTADVRREGPEGAETDSITGREAYLRWSADLLDPLHGFSWTPLRIVPAVDGRTVLVEAESRYWPAAGDEPFGYRLAVVFDLDEAGLIEQISYYWKTPKQRLTWDTVSGRDGSDV